MVENNSGNTSYWRSVNTNENSDAHEIIRYVYEALKTKGYDPLTQLVGFLTTGDPTYITSFAQARSMICRIERDEIVEELVSKYLSSIDSERGIN